MTNNLKKTVILTFDDAVTSHYDNVVPILKEYGFGATFFICRFTKEWRTQHGQYLLSASQIKEISDNGFEIGNHTWSHPDLRNCDTADIDLELDLMTNFLQRAGVPPCVSFAYPGGPFAANAVPVLKRHGFSSARSTEPRYFDKNKDDWMNLPSFPIQGTDKNLFYDTVSKCPAGSALCLVFHGVPEYVHPWVNTELTIFKEYMDYLKKNSYQVTSIRDFL